MKPWTEARNNNKYMKYHSKLSFWNVSRKVDYHAGGKFIHGPKRRKENQLLSPEYPCWLSLFSPLLENQNPWTKTF